MNNKLKLISSTYIGRYNDTTVFNTLINYNEKDYYICIERISHDMQDPPYSWNIITDLHLTKEEKAFLVDNISTNTPIYCSDASPKMYNKEFTKKNEPLKIKMVKLGCDIDETRNRRIWGIVPTIDKKFLFIELSLINRPDIKHTSLSNTEYEKKYPNKEYIGIDFCFRVDLPEDFHKNHSKEFRAYFYKDFFEFEYTNSNIVKVLQIFNPNIEDIELTTDYYIDKFCEEKGFFKLYDERLNHSYEPLKIDWIGLPNKNTAIVKLLYTCYASNGTEYTEELREKHSIPELIQKYGKEKIQKLINEDIEKTCAIHSTPEAKADFKKYKKDLFEKYCQEVSSTISNEIEDIKENYDYDY